MEELINVSTHGLSRVFSKCREIASPLNTLQMYLAASFIPPFVATLSFLLFFLLTSQIFNLVGIIVNQDVIFTSVLALFFHIVVSFLPLSIPSAAFFATIFCLNRLSTDSEIIAMQSFGFSRWDILKPFLFMGVTVAIAVFFLGRNLVPHSKVSFTDTMARLTSEGVLTNVRAKTFFTDIPNVVLFAENVAEKGNQLFDVFIRYKDRGGTERVIMAKEGRLVRQYFSEDQTPAMRIRLRKGNIIQYDKNHQDMEKVHFETYDFPILEGGRQLGFVTKDAMRSNEILSSHIEKVKNELYTLMINEKKTAQDKARIEELQKSLAKGQIEYWNRINTPILCLVFTVLGLGLGIKGGRGRKKDTSLRGISCILVYYALFFFGISLARRGEILAWFAIFTPTLLLGFVAARYYKRLDWLP